MATMNFQLLIPNINMYFYYKKSFFVVKEENCKYETQQQN